MEGRWKASSKRKKQKRHRTGTLTTEIKATTRVYESLEAFNARADKRHNGLSLDALMGNYGGDQETTMADNLRKRTKNRNTKKERSRIVKETVHDMRTEGPTNEESVRLKRDPLGEVISIKDFGDRVDSVMKAAEMPTEDGRGVDYPPELRAYKARSQEEVEQRLAALASALGTDTETVRGMCRTPVTALSVLERLAKGNARTEAEAGKEQEEREQGWDRKR